MFCPAWIRGNSGETPIEANKTASVTQARTHHVRWENDSFFFFVGHCKGEKGRAAVLRLGRQKWEPK